MRPSRCWWFGLLWSLTVAADRACDFTLDGLEFNLCPLFTKASTVSEFAESTPPTQTTHRYNISLGAPLKPDGTLPSELQCPEGTWICLIVVNTRPSRPSEPPRILQVVPVAGDLGLNPKAKLLAKANDKDLHAPLQVTLHGGHYNGRSQKASFQLHCDHESEEPGPTFSWQWNGTHTFSWRTKHACPRALPPGAPGPKPEEPDVDPPATPPVDPDADAEDKDSKHTSPASLSIFILVFWIVACMFALRILYPPLSRWSRRFSWRFSMTSPKSKGFRPPALSLIRWAAEENPEEYNVDSADGFMHSLSDGEETPLTPNSRETFTVGRYGGAG
ncbi:autophagy-related protein 27-domain-containing protein [Mycena latifolia]|nr:autophagy-related protein 27-domain-containing protein [Mycena latifolia]